jgi:hypothetical protein
VDYQANAGRSSALSRRRGESSKRGSVVNHAVFDVFAGAAGEGGAFNLVAGFPESVNGVACDVVRVAGVQIVVVSARAFDVNDPLPHSLNASKDFGLARPHGDFSAFNS